MLEAWQRALDGDQVAVDVLHDALASEPGARCIAFYQSPWDAFARACLEDGASGAEAAQIGRDGLRRWSDDAARLIEAAARWPSRVLLVNAGRLASREDELARVLVQSGWCSGVDAPRLDDTPATLDTTLLARLFEDFAPEAWDTYESLESQACLLGREAEFRVGLVHPGDPLDDAMAVWADAIARRKSALSPPLPEERAAEDDTDTMNSLRAELASRDRLVRELGSENELLHEHVDQLRQELLDQAATCGELREMVVRLTAAADQARLLVSK